MRDDFENTPLRDEDGEIIRTADGKPILYKHFSNDLPDEDEEVFSNLSAVDQLAHLKKLGITVPDRLIKRVESEERKKSNGTP